MRRGIAVVAALGVVALIAGCTPKFNGEIKGKQVSDNKVQIKFKICVRDDNTPEDDCQPPPSRAARGFTAYHLLAFRVPKGTDVRDTFSSRGGELTYTRNRSYARELKRLAPTPEGTKWFGFVSEGFGDPPTTRARYKLKFGLPDDAGKKFKHRPVTGYAATDGQLDCGDDAFEPSNESDPNAACISDPTTRRAVRRSLKIDLD